MKALKLEKSYRRILPHLQLLAERLGLKDFDPTDFELVIERFGKMVYRVAMADLKQSEDAEDCYQEVFLRYVRQAEKIESEEHCKAWLLRVTVNYCHDLRRSSHFSRRAELSEEVEAVLGEDDPAYERIEADENLTHLLAKLNPDEARCIHLFYFEQLSINEIAELGGESKVAVRVRLHRARKKLKDYWQ